MPRVTFKILGSPDREDKLPDEVLDLPADIDYAVVGPVMLHISGTSGPQAYSILSTVLGKWTVLESAEEIHRRFSDARLGMGRKEWAKDRVMVQGPPERLTEYGPTDEELRRQRALFPGPFPPRPSP